MALPPLLSLKDVSLTFGGTPLLDHAEISIAPGERACLVGRNGSGKSTLLRIAAGLVEPDQGVRFVQPGATIRYLSQEPDLSGFATTLAAVQASLGPADDPFRASYLLQELGLTGDEEPSRLSGGEARRCALAGVLAPDPDILLLDEPTNHLDLSATEWLEAELTKGKSALVLISHDRAFLRRLSQSTIWLDRGKTRRIEQGFGGFEAWRDKILEEEERDRHKLDRKIDAEGDWLRYGVTARRKRNVRRLGALHELRRERGDARRATGSVTMTMSQADLSGKLVIEAERISKSFDGRPIVSDLSLRVLRGDRVGIVGANGLGKTTLLKLLIGALAPDSGTVRLGTNLELVSLDQHRESLDDRATVTETLTEGRGDMVVVGGQPRHVAAYMKDFLFSPEQARSPVGVLSGGERNRLMLARALARPSNLLVLDEPTNDLDLETLDLLQEQLGAYPGTILLVSHDRDFLDRVVSSVLVAEGGGRWVEYAGGYTDMLAQRGADVSPRARAASPPSSPKASRSPSPPEPSRKRRLGFNEQHELKTLPGHLAEIEARIAKLNATLADPGLYARDEALMKRAAAALAEAQARREAAENRWLELEVLRETLES